VDGLLSFWVLSAVFAVVGAALKGLIRPLSWATLAIATLFIAPGKVAETVNAVRAGEVKLAFLTATAIRSTRNEFALNQRQRSRAVRP
jgi:hypothetical protein